MPLLHSEFTFFNTALTKYHLIKCDTKHIMRHIFDEIHSLTWSFTHGYKKLILILLCIFLPPVAVYMEKGLNKDFFINLILTFFFFLPGTIHALWLTMK